MFLFFYFFFTLFLCFTIYQVICNHKMDNDLLFLIACNYLLNITVALFYGYYHSLLFSTISIILLTIFATELIFKITTTFNKIKFFSLPYLFLVYFSLFFLIFQII